jgi:hypothetical protein
MAEIEGIMARIEGVIARAMAASCQQISNRILIHFAQVHQSRCKEVHFILVHCQQFAGSLITRTPKRETPCSSKPSSNS